MSNLFWLRVAQMARLRPFFPRSHGKPRVDDRRVPSGMIFIVRNGLRRCDAPREHGPPETLCNCWKRWSDKGGLRPDDGRPRRPGRRSEDGDVRDKVWVTGITHIRTQEGFAYLAVVIDLYSRRVIGWSMQSRQTADVVLQALLMAVWRRKPQGKVLVHSDQGSQFTSMDWAAFLRAHNLEHSMSRRGNCHDNAVAESFFSLLKRERIRRRTSRTREEARQDMFDYIEMFYNPKRKHARNGMLSPAEFERQQMMRREGV